MADPVDPKELSVHAHCCDTVRDKTRCSGQLSVHAHCCDTVRDKTRCPGQLSVHAHCCDTVRDKTRCPRQHGGLWQTKKSGGVKGKDIAD